MDKDKIKDLKKALWNFLWHVNAGHLGIASQLIPPYYVCQCDPGTVRNLLNRMEQGADYLEEVLKLPKV